MALSTARARRMAYKRHGYSDYVPLGMRFTKPAPSYTVGERVIWQGRRGVIEGRCWLGATPHYDVNFGWDVVRCIAEAELRLSTSTEGNAGRIAVKVSEAEPRRVMIQAAAAPLPAPPPAPFAHWWLQDSFPRCWPRLATRFCQ